MEPFTPEELTPGALPDMKPRTLAVGPVAVVFEDRDSLRVRLADLAATGDAGALLAKVNPNLPTEQELGATVWAPKEQRDALAAATSGLRVWIGPKGKFDAAYVDLGTAADFLLAKFKFAPNEVDLFRAIGIEQIYVSVELPDLWKRVQLPETTRRLVSRDLKHPLDKRPAVMP